jgi:hypothetical protein
LVESLWKTVWQCLEKLKIELLYDSSVTTEYISKGNKINMLKNYLHFMFTIVLFTIAKKWKQFITLSPNECTEEIWHIYYDSAIKNEILSFMTI